MPLHHMRLVPGSPSNRSNDRRIGFAIRYIPTDVAQLASEDIASLMRGEDRYHHFMAEPQPSRDRDPEFVVGFTAAITETTRGSSIVAPTSPATTSRRHLAQRA